MTAMSIFNRTYENLQHIAALVHIQYMWLQLVVHTSYVDTLQSAEFTANARLPISRRDSISHVDVYFASRILYLRLPTGSTDDP